MSGWALLDAGFAGAGVGLTLVSLPESVGSHLRLGKAKRRITPFQTVTEKHG